jgi:hypothetical protein
MIVINRNSESASVELIRDDFQSKTTYDIKNNKLTYKDSIGKWSEKIYDNKGKELTYKDSNGITRGI